ncbi:putative lipoprotein [Crenobacter luteus]|uniref:LPS translocon maturation chaperone LptM n=1 Tax=Crenobacter luteus TaxID=1452487 RepID=UPI0009EDF360|nr:lipoprotein [Crenobacter luteus]TCP11409.1 putative lipoprotein [Crenobacter luteus]
MRTVLALALFSSLLFAGCGYKGPLYLPGDKPAKSRSQSAPAPAPKVQASQAQ